MKSLFLTWGVEPLTRNLLCVDADRRVKRQKVGDHMLLSGDNIDLLVAKKLESQIEVIGSSSR